MRRLGQAALGLLAAATLAALTVGPAAAATGTPHIKHVFIVVLENEGFSSTFGPDSRAPYLSKELTRRGELLPRYYGIGHLSLGNYIAMISGQAPNPQTQSDCPYFNEFLPATPAAGGQFVGYGCVYPRQVQTVGDQLAGVGLGWREYAQGIDAGAPTAAATTCLHPMIGAADMNRSATRDSQYATRHNPFVYFHSVIDSPACASNVVGLSALRGDLQRARDTPAYSLISPDLCNDGHDEPCVDGRPGGLVSADHFLRRRIPEIVRSPAYRDHGLVVVTFDESDADASACCSEPAGPNTSAPGGSGPGGGRVGAVLLSPCIRPGSVDRHSYNHYSLLRSVEENFRLPNLGYAGEPGLKPFGSSALNRPGCGDQ